MSSAEAIDIGTAIELAADQIINARDFCGDERAAAVEAFAEHGLRPTNTRMALAAGMANGRWRSHQCAAGVTKPISPAERASINRQLEDET